MAAAIPFAIQAGGALVGHFAAKKAAKAAQARAQARSPEELAALNQVSGAAGALGQQGSALFGQAMPGLSQASNYYATLLSGNRAAQQQATAAPRAAIGDIYRGASRGLERSGLQGAQRDTAQAELTREQAGRLAGLTTGVQPMAAEALAGLSGQMAGLGTQATGAGGNLYAMLLGQGQQNRQQAVGVGTQAGHGAANTIGQLAALAGNAYAGWRGGRTGGVTGGINAMPTGAGVPPSWINMIQRPPGSYPY
jgi:hypothetical protein